MWDTFIQLLVSGVAFGFLYALVAIEYTLVFNSCRLLNFSHITLIAYGAYFFAGTFILKMNLPFWISAIAAIITMALLGAIIAVIIFIPLRSYRATYAIIATMMLGTIMVEAIRFIWGPVPLALKGFMIGTFKISTATIARANIYIIGMAAAVVVLLLLFMNKTKLGKSMRCVAENREAAEYMGINVRFNMMFTISLSLVICCVIGIMIIPLYQVRTTMASVIGLKGFASGIIGSFGSVPGAILGGILVGLFENIALLVVPSAYKDVVSFALVLVVLMIKPNGLLRSNPNRAPRIKAEKKTKAVEVSD